MNNKVITFWSHCPGSGASFTAINVAKALVEKKINCVLFDFDLANPSLATYFDNEDMMHGLDNLLPYVAGNNLTQNILSDNYQKKGSVTWLRGTELPEHSRYIKAEDLSGIVEIAKEISDVLILDTSGIVNNAGTYVSLKMADKTFIVTDKDTIKIRRYSQIKAYADAEIKNLSLILNMGCNKAVPLDIKEVSEYYGITESYELPDLGKEFTKALNKGKWHEYMSKNKHSARDYNKKLQGVIQSIIKD